MNFAKDIVVENGPNLIRIAQWVTFYQKKWGKTTKPLN